MKTTPKKHFFKFFFLLQHLHSPFQVNRERAAALGLSGFCFRSLFTWDPSGGSLRGTRRRAGSGAPPPCAPAPSCGPAPPPAGASPRSPPGLRGRPVWAIRGRGGLGCQTDGGGGGRNAPAGPREKNVQNVQKNTQKRACFGKFEKNVQNALCIPLQTATAKVLSSMSRVASEGGFSGWAACKKHLQISKKKVTPRQLPQVDRKQSNQMQGRRGHVGAELAAG